jgi:hypothetical protein
VHYFGKEKGLGQILGDLFSNSSGHPDGQLENIVAQKTFLFEDFGQAQGGVLVRKLCRRGRVANGDGDDDDHEGKKGLAVLHRVLSGINIIKLLFGPKRFWLKYVHIALIKQIKS